MKVRIQNNDGMGHTTRYTSVETGQELEYISDVTIHIAPDRFVTAQLTQHYPVVDIIADAEIRQVCPCCGQPTDRPTGPVEGE